MRKKSKIGSMKTIASVIIITKNQLAFLKRTLPALLGQNFPMSYEIIVVDSGSTDGALKYINKKKPVVLVETPPENFNYARTFNLGAGQAKGKILVRLSGDCIPLGKNWLSEMVKLFDNPKVGGVYGRYTISGRKEYGYPDFWPAGKFPKNITYYSATPYPLMGISFVNSIFAWSKKYRTIEKKVFNFTGGCCAVRKSIWQKRPLNENLIAAEDAEYAWFLHLMGYDIVYNPKIRTLHEHKLNLINTARTYSRLNKWQLIFDWEIGKYWLGRLFGKNPYSCFKFR